MRKITESKCIYLIWNTETKRVKIGVAYNPIKRMEALKYQSGCKLELIYYTRPIEKSNEFETHLHLIFKDYRYLGEWFNMNYSKPMEVIKSLEGDYKLCYVYTLLNQGLNPTQIAKQLGVSRSAIVKNMISKGINVKSIRKKYDKPQSKKEFIKGSKPKIHNLGTDLNIAEMVRINNEKMKAKKKRLKT